MPTRSATMKLLFNSLLLLMCLLGFVACEDDDEKDGNYPSLYTDMLCVSTAADGTLTTAILDNGEHYDVSAQGLASSTSDATLRCLASYTLNNGSLKLRSIARVFSDDPYPVESFFGSVVRYDPSLLPRDPVKLISMWKSGGYINLHLGVLTTGQGTHSYAFCRDEDGAYSLLHLRPQGDAESYTEHLYMSMPIPEGMEHLSFSVYTYDGVYTRTF